MTHTTVTCKSHNDALNFFLIHRGIEYYLFSQGYNYKLFQFYKNGVPLNKALDPRRSYDRNCKKMFKINDKLRAYIRYIEQEYGIVVLNSTREKNNDRARSKRIQKCA